MLRSPAGVPDAREALLLKVCFLPAAEAGALWDAHAVDVRLDELDPESHGLLPLLHRRLVEIGRQPPSLDLLHGIRRRLWVQNELRMRSTRDALDALAANDVRSALIGGAGVLVAHLQLDLRPVNEVDVVVPTDQAAAAGAALVRAGWTPARAWRTGYLLDVAATRFSDRDGRSVVLCSSSSPPYCSLDRATTTTLGAGIFDVVAPADLLLHVILDGSRATRTARVRWTSDVLAVLRSGHPLDWAALVASAHARRAGATVASALGQLDRLVPLGLAPAVVAELGAVRRPRWEHRLGADAAGPTTALRAHVRRASGSGLRRMARGLPAHLCEVWDVDSAGHLPAAAARRLLERTPLRARVP